MKSVDKRKRIGHYIAAVILVGVFVVLDQITKYLASACLKGQNPVVIAEGVFELHYLENRGAAFGLFQNQQFFILGAHNHIHINIHQCCDYMVLHTSSYEQKIPAPSRMCGIYHGGSSRELYRPCNAAICC